MRCPRLKNNKEKLWKILNWSIVPILGSVSYFFITETWNDYRIGKTNLSFEQMPIEKQPTVTICIGRPGTLTENRISMNDVPNDIYHYSILGPGKIAATSKLQEGENEVMLHQDETIVFRKMQYCYSVKSTSKKYNQKEHQFKALKVTFPNKTIHDKTNMFRKLRLWVFFTIEEDSYSLDVGHKLTEGEGYEVKMRVDSFYDQYFECCPNFESNEPFVYVHLKPVFTKYIHEKSGCRDGSAWQIFAPIFAEKVKKMCGKKACAPYALPNTTLALCDTKKDESQCSLNTFTNTMKKSDDIFNSDPCIKRDYTGYHDMNVGLMKATGINMGDDSSTSFVVIYLFQTPMTVLVNEEYYVVPTLDLIGVIGGTLGMLLGFSFYGAFSDIYKALVKLASKITCNLKGTYLIN